MTLECPGQLDMLDALGQHDVELYEDGERWWHWRCRTCGESPAARWSHRELADLMAGHHARPRWSA